MRLVSQAAADFLFQLSLTALNSSKSAYASFAFDASKFFSSYSFAPAAANVDGRFTCRIYNKVRYPSGPLSSRLTVRRRSSRSSKAASSTQGGEIRRSIGAKSAYKTGMIKQNAASSSRCSPTKACPTTPLLGKLLADWPSGVTKTYKLTYESVEIMHALFDKQSAQNRWSIHSSALKEAIEYFGPRTEQLDIYAENGRVTYTSFTEKISNGKGRPYACLSLP